MARKGPSKKSKAKTSGRTAASRTSEKRGPNKQESKKQGRRSGFGLHDDLVEEALVSGEYRDLLEDYFGEAVYEDLRTMVSRARTARSRGGPRVLILPGIMGSKLGRERWIFDDTIWIDPVDIMKGELLRLAMPDNENDISPLGVILFTYLKLKLQLQLAGFDASFHPYDWRYGVGALGASLAERVREETGTGRPNEHVYLVAHSMGGLVSRAALKTLENSGGADKVRSLVMLGTPNFGSFSPVQVLSGNHSLAQKVSALDLKNSHETLVEQVFSSFLSLYEMLPARQRYTQYDLYDTENWPPTGFAPRADLLAQGPAVHDGLSSDPEKMVLVAGIDQETVVGVRREDDEFRFQVSNEGDGTVPLNFATLDGVTTYYVEEEHGSLPNNRTVARAVIDILESGTTSRLPTSWAPTRRGAMREVRAEELAPLPFGGRTGDKLSSKEIRGIIEDFAAPSTGPWERVATPVTAPATPLSDEPIVIGRKRQARIDLRIAHGDITKVDTRAIVLGTFKDVAPSGAARAIDRALDGAITEFTERRLMSSNVGDVFVMPANRYRVGAELIVFAGLGTYDDFSEEVLRDVAENAARVLIRTKVDDFATVLMSTGSGLPMADVLAGLTEGFLRGVRDTTDGGKLRSITMVENDRGRFDQLRQEAVRLTTTPLFDDVEATVFFEELPPAADTAAGVARQSGGGPDRRDPTYLLVREMADPNSQVTDPSLRASFTVRASVLTSGARSTVVTDTVDVDAIALNRHLEKIETNGFSHDGLADFGQKLGELVLPRMVRAALSGIQGLPLMVIHDARTSRIPWETLNIPQGDSAWFPAGGAGLSRKYEAEDLSVAKWLEQRRLSGTLSVLLIVNPTLDLDGAEAEGHRIKAILAAQPAIELDELWREKATLGAVGRALRSGKYDVVHYAGHAFFDPVNRARSGVICHGHQVLSGADLARVGNLPALMFFNACEAARIRSAPERQQGVETAKRLETNVGLAEALLRAGVGNYIGTYWPVGDAPAKVFGETFYKAIADGKTIGEALQEGRTQVRDLESVDWADYIHYGSPGFRVKLKP